MDDTKVDNNQYVKVENGFESNPWAVEDASVFLKYCCPECDFQIWNHDIFFAHALENHEKSIVLFGPRTDIENLIVKKEQLDYDEINVNEFLDVDEYDPLVEVKPSNSPSTQDGIFRCVRCKYSNESKTDVERHSLATHNAHFFCQTCGKILEKNETIRSHFAKSNGCKTTKDEFKPKSDSKRHIASLHDETKPHKCPTCGGGFSHKFLLKNHIDAVHEGKKPYGCDKPNCGATFAKNSALKQHIASVHEGRKPYVCKICDAKYSAKSGLKKHISTTHADILPLNFGIDAINELINADAVEIPKKLKLKKHKCDICELVFNHRSHLNKHVSTVHEVNKVCELCFIDCKSRKELKEHIIKNHQIGKQKCCPHCEKTFRDIDKLKFHIDLNHPEHGEKKHLCTVCGKGFMFMSSCRIHEVNQHEKFPCHICGKQLSRKFALVDHLSSAHNFEPNEHVCEICGYSTLSKQTLQKHKRIKHIRKNFHKCPHCEKQSHELAAIHVHIDSKHPDHDKKTVFCDHCSKSFIFAASLTKHLNNLKTMAMERAKKEIKNAKKLL